MAEGLIFLRIVVSFGYLASCICYIRFFYTKDPLWGRWGARSLGGSLSVHTVLLFFLAFNLGRLPLASPWEALSACMWLFGLVYLFLEARLKERSLGAFILPIILILQTLSGVFIDVNKPLSHVLTGIFFELHVLLMLLAYSGFAISFIVSIMYILLSHEIQARHLGLFYARMPSLEFLDRLSAQAILLGFLVITVGGITGVIMASKAWGFFWKWDPKLSSVFVAWLIYTLFLLTRWVAGWRGQRSAYISVVGFLWVLFNFLILSHFFTNLHTF